MSANQLGLLACPICGSSADGNQLIDDSWWIYCTNDECKCNVGYFETWVAAFEAWGAWALLPKNRKMHMAMQELNAFAALIRRPPLDDVQVAQDAALRIAAAIEMVAGQTREEPFGYWVEQKGAEPVLLRKPAYIPEPSNLRTVTPLYNRKQA